MAGSGAVTFPFLSFGHVPRRNAPGDHGGDDLGTILRAQGGHDPLPLHVLLPGKKEDDDEQQREPTEDAREAVMAVGDVECRFAA